MSYDAFPYVTIAVEGAEVKPSITMDRKAIIFELKQRIMDVLGIIIYRQTLWLGDQKLEDTMSIECITNAASSVRLSVTPQPTRTFSVYARPRGIPTEYTEHTLEFPTGGKKLEVKEAESVLELKERIVAMLNKKMQEKKIEISFGTQDISLYLGILEYARCSHTVPILYSQSLYHWLKGGTKIVFVSKIV